MNLSLDRYPIRTVLRDGSPCSIRPPTASDEAAFRDFHLEVPERERLFIRNQIRDGTLFREWTCDPEFEDTLPLLAFVDGELKALGVLRERAGGWKRHIGKVTLLTHPEHHGKGLLEELLGEIVEAARNRGLARLEAEFNGERESAIRAMSAFGFEELARLPGYIQDMDAEYHDYVLMGMELVASFENLGAGD